MIKMLTSFMLFIVTLSAEPILLVDSHTGESYGPAEIGQQMDINGKTYTIKAAPDLKAIALENRLKGIRLKNVEWEDASVNELIDYIVVVSRELGQRINMITTPRRGASTPTPTLSINRKQMSAYELLQEICMKGNLTFHIEGNVVIIQKKPRFPKADLKKAAAVKEAMKNIIIPEMAFENASLKDGVNFLMGTAKHRGSPFTILIDQAAPVKVPRPQAAPLGDDFFDGLEHVELPEGYRNPEPIDEVFRDDSAALTIGLRRISMHEALNFICEIMGAKWYVGEQAIIIQPAP